MDGKLEKLQGFTTPLAVYEIGNAVWKQVYQRKAISPEEGMKVLEALLEVAKDLEKVEAKSGMDVLRLAVERGLTFYDTAYLQPAIERGFPLVTDDEKLYSVAKDYVKVLRSWEL